MLCNAFAALKFDFVYHKFQRCQELYSTKWYKFSTEKNRMCKVEQRFSFSFLKKI